MEIFASAAHWMAESARWAFSRSPSGEVKAEGAGEAFTAQPADEKELSKGSDVNVKQIKPILDVVRKALPAIAKEFTGDPSLLMRKIKVPGGEVSVCRDNQLYLDLGKVIYAGASKQVREMIDIVGSKRVIVHILDKKYHLWTREREAMVKYGELEFFPSCIGCIPLEEKAKANKIEWAVVQECYPTALTEHLIGLQERKEAMSPLQKLDGMQRLALALDTMHQNGEVHRDLKPDNVLLDDQKQFTLTDFGTIMRDQERETYFDCGTMLYWAPELWILRQNYFRYGKADYYNKPIDLTFHKPADIWSLGLIFYTMEVMNMPLFLTPLHNLDRKLLKTEKGRLQVWDASQRIQELSVESKDFTDMKSRLAQADSSQPARHRLILDCLHPDPRRRPTITDILHRLVEMAPLSGEPAASPEIASAAAASAVDEMSL